MAANVWGTFRGSPLVIAAAGASNLLGSGTGAPWRTLPGNVTYYTNKTGTFQQEAGWLNNPGLSLGMIDTIVNTYGYTGSIVLLEYGINGGGLQTFGTTYAAEHVAAIQTLGLIPTVLVTYLGTADSKVHSQALNSRANAQTVTEKYRTVWGGGLGAVLCGIHTPDAGWDADCELVDSSILDWATDHEEPFAAYIYNRDLEIQGGGNDHLTGGEDGGSHEAGRRIAEMLYHSELL